jgi:broad specificity phosphatase PhoE
MPPPSTIMIVRHAEKPTKSNEQLGIRPNGEHDRHSLSVRGWTRAGALVGLFAPQLGEPRAGLTRPDAIYASGHADDGSRRPVQTVTPLAERLSKDIHSGCGAVQESELAAKLEAHRGAVLVAWQHEAISKLVGELGAVAPAVPQHWPDDRFDVVWTLTRDGSG